MSALTDGDKRWLIDVIRRILEKDMMPVLRDEIRKEVDRRIDGDLLALVEGRARMAGRKAATDALLAEVGRQIRVVVEGVAP